MMQHKLCFIDSNWN